MTTFPSRCKVYQAQEGQRIVITVFGYGSGCVATGDTWEEAEAKAIEWTRKNLENGGLLGRAGLLEWECSRLCDALIALSPT